MAKQISKMDAKIRIIKAFLEDAEFLGGGVPEKEEYYMKKYGFTEGELISLESYLYCALVLDKFSHKWDYGKEN